MKIHDCEQGTLEWTAEIVQGISGNCALISAQAKRKIADAHNAALAAERDKVQTLVDALKKSKSGMRLHLYGHDWNVEADIDAIDHALAKVKEGK